ncbi:MAG TPA: N-acetylmuramoyl-L-alanine amidase [Candidatus Enterenecus stercoripullorum]|nr:N-acetylmuramoyl-L-alanine amidase [Candidatus Enterenecus stercoripullorum]
MNLLQCLLTENDCYQTGQSITPKGVMVHSTGANNPTLKRYVQPLEGAADYDELIGLLGYNRNGNDWNRPGTNACVHAFIGKLADGSVATVQTLPWTMRGWHAGNGTTRPSANNTHISFEICEDGLDDADYFAKVYREAVEFTAYLCGLYGLDPMKEETVICHSEGYRLGMASGHADVEHWFPRFGKSMDDFRADVAAEMEDEDMTQEKFDEMMENYLSRRALREPSDWSKGSRDWAQQEGLIKGVGDLDGDGQNDFSYKSFCTREELVTILDRLEHKARA